MSYSDMIPITCMRETCITNSRDWEGTWIMYQIQRQAALENTGAMTSTNLQIWKNTSYGVNIWVRTIRYPDNESAERLSGVWYFPWLHYQCLFKDLWKEIANTTHPVQGGPLLSGVQIVEPRYFKKFLYEGRERMYQHLDSMMTHHKR